jgi:ribonuclease E
MVLESNRDLVVRRLVECLGRDRTKHQVAEVTSLGLVQMTRKRVGQGLLESFSEPCETCGGRGVIVHTEPVDEKRQARVERFDDRPRGERGGRDRDRGRGGGGDDKARDDKPRDDAPRDERAAGSADGSDAATPRKRSRGGRGRGGRSEGAPGDVVAVDAPVSEVPDIAPELSEQPSSAEEDLPVVPEILVSVADDEPVEAAAEPEPESAAPEPEAAAPEPEASTPEPAGPKRRRRATSRPAGPPTITV